MLHRVRMRVRVLVRMRVVGGMCADAGPSSNAGAYTDAYGGIDVVAVLVRMQTAVLARMLMLVRRCGWRGRWCGDMMWFRTVA